MERNRPGPMTAADKVPPRVRTCGETPSRPLRGILDCLGRTVDLAVAWAPVKLRDSFDSCRSDLHVALSCDGVLPWRKEKRRENIHQIEAGAQISNVVGRKTDVGRESW